MWGEWRRRRDEEDEIMEAEARSERGERRRRTHGGARETEREESGSRIDKLKARRRRKVCDKGKKKE